MALDLEDAETKTAFEAAVKSAVTTQLPTAIATAVETETVALKKQIETVIGEKRGLQDKLGKFGDLDADAIAKMITTLDSNQDVKDLAEGKVDEVFARRFEKINLSFEGQIADLTTKLASAEDTAASAKGRADSKIIEVDLRRTAETSGVLPAAIDDIVMKGANLFTVDDNGDILQRDSAGKIIEKDSKPITPQLWMDAVKEASPHFWPGSKGSGMDGSEGGDRTAGEQQLAAAVKSGDMKAYRALRNKERGVDDTHPRNRPENQNLQNKTTN